MSFERAYLEELEKIAILGQIIAPSLALPSMVLAPAAAALASDHIESKGKVIDAPKSIFKRPISGIIGRHSSPITALMLGTKSTLGPGPKSTDPEIKKVLNVYKNNPHLKNTKIYLNHKPFVETMSRILKNKRMSLLSKAFGTLTAPITSLTTSIDRADHYDPHADAVTVYTNHPGVLAHELGHAVDFGKKKHPGLYAALYKVPFANLLHEGKANIEALRAIKKDESLRKSKRIASILGGSYGSYVGGGIEDALNNVGKSSPPVSIPVLGKVPLVPLVAPWVGRGVGFGIRAAANLRERFAKNKKATPARRSSSREGRRLAFA